MMDDMEQKHYLALARSLVSDLEQGQHDEAGRTIEEIAKLRNNESSQALGSSIESTDQASPADALEAALGQILTQDIPEIMERLNYVDGIINDSASETLNHVERCLDACEQVTARASAEAEGLKEQTRSLHQGLNDILVAQSFQDLSGQVLNRVIEMVGGIERYMVQIVKHGAHDHHKSDQDSVAHSDKDETEPYGPRIPGLENPDMLKNQGEVDDLLSSMGF